jgi:hypothetical protein
MDFPSFLILWWIIIAALVLIVWLFASGQGKKIPARRYRLAPARYAKGEFDEQMEFDLRLTYKRFKELYPFSNIGYEDYKKLQMERAFRRAVGSEKNRRMVR